MPVYHVEHAIPLTISQQDELAEAITKLHSERFSTPRLFVNVHFVDVADAVTYIGGKRRTGSHIKANVRSGPSRSQEDWDELAKDIEEAWERIVGPGLPKLRRGDPDVDTSLRSVILLGDIIGGRELGLVLPQAGEDVEWLWKNWDQFQQRADEGEEDFRDLVSEARERGLLDFSGKTPKPLNITTEKLDREVDLQSPRTLMKRGASGRKLLEEELGWGDSA